LKPEKGLVPVADLKLNIAFWDYDRTSALADGTPFHCNSRISQPRLPSLRDLHQSSQRHQEA
jgi:hypothetical protein